MVVVGDGELIIIEGLKKFIAFAARNYFESRGEQRILKEMEFFMELEEKEVEQSLSHCE